MGYVPPLGNATSFLFNSPGYSPPIGSSVVFNFGAVVPPPAGASLPTGARIALLDKDEWFFMGPKRFTPPPISAVTPLYPLRMRQSVDWQDYQAEWLMPKRKAFYTPVTSPVGGVRPTLYVIT